MKKRLCAIGMIGLSCIVLLCSPGEKAEMQPGQKPYDVAVMYDENQPQPPVVSGTKGLGWEAPSDAVVLFDGTGLSAWTDSEGKPAQWKVERGYMEVVPRTGKIFTKEEFGACQLHLEWASPTEITGDGQGRGNSGIFFMNKYELQVLDSYNSPTYPAGMAGSVYGMNPPLVNATRAPGEWQSYDVIFHPPVFKAGALVKPATITAFLNGVLVQDNYELIGATAFKKKPEYSEHPEKLPMALQDHGNPVRFRNIWIRHL